MKPPVFVIPEGNLRLLLPLPVLAESRAKPPARFQPNPFVPNPNHLKILEPNHGGGGSHPHMHLDQIQQALREARLDGWLFYDHHHRDPIAERILGLPTHGLVSRRWYYFIPPMARRPSSSTASSPPASTPSKAPNRSTAPGRSSSPASPPCSTARLPSPCSTARATPSCTSPWSTPAPSSSCAKWAKTSSPPPISSASSKPSSPKPRSPPTSKPSASSTRSSAPASTASATSPAPANATSTPWSNGSARPSPREGLYTDHGPNVSAGPNSADSHYDPTPASSRTIKPGDFILIDIWAKLAAPGEPNQPDPAAIWYDITWTGVVDREPTAREQLIFTTVRDARDAAIRTVQQAFASNTPIAGWQADDAAREVIRAAGFAPAFTHRTGHNIAADLHGNGAHLDNLETHDERLILPNTCFSVEPGLYFPEARGANEPAFGIRSEVDMIAYPGRAVVTGPAQTELLRI